MPGKVWTMHVYIAHFSGGYRIVLGCSEKELSTDGIVRLFKKMNERNTIGEIVKIGTNNHGFSYEATISTGEVAEIEVFNAPKWEE